VSTLCWIWFYVCWSVTLPVQLVLGLLRLLCRLLTVVGEEGDYLLQKWSTNVKHCVSVAAPFPLLKLFREAWEKDRLDRTRLIEELEERTTHE